MVNNKWVAWVAVIALILAVIAVVVLLSGGMTGGVINSSSAANKGSLKFVNVRYDSDMNETYVSLKLVKTGKILCEDLSAGQTCNFGKYLVHVDKIVYSNTDKLVVFHVTKQNTELDSEGRLVTIYSTNPSVYNYLYDNQVGSGSFSVA